MSDLVRLAQEVRSRAQRDVEAMERMTVTVSLARTDSVDSARTLLATLRSVISAVEDFVRTAEDNRG
ncbi:MAG: hypothetical protein ACJ8EB_14170 [Allosphingosinicella sp.]